MLSTPDALRDVAAAVEKWRVRPDLFARDVFGVRLLPFQKRIIEKMYECRRVAVPSGHAVGKTFVAALLVRHFLLSGGRVLTTATTWPQVEKILWGEIRRQARAATARGITLGEDLSLTQLKTANGGEAYGLSTDEPTAFQGSHWPRQLIIFDEADGVRPEIHAAAESLMSGGECYWLMIANPERTRGPFYDACHRPDLWHVEHISCLDHPNVVTGREVVPGAVSREWVEERRRVWGEDSNEWRKRILGQFPTSDSGALITTELLHEASERPPTARDGRHMGVDVSLGGDETVAVLVVDRVVTDIRRWREPNLMASTGRIAQLLTEWRVQPTAVHIDACGLGAGPVARLRELGHDVHAVDFGGAPSGAWSGVHLDTRFINQRVEGYYTVRALLRDGELNIAARFTDMWADLCAVQMIGPDSSGACRLEPKDAVKKRLGRSPDCGDALVLALCRKPMSFGVRWL